MIIGQYKYRPNLDQFRIVTNTLQEQALKSILLHHISNLLSPLPGGVGRVKYANISVFSQELQSIIQRGVRHGYPQSQSIRIIMAEKLMIPENDKKYMFQ